MAVKLFIVGLPGSGKSAIARYIEDYVPERSWLISDHRWLTSRFNDYLILYSMYKDDKNCKRFKPAVPGGFNIVDFSAFDDALKNLGQWIARLILSKRDQPEEILVIEFARNDYKLAFAQFDKEFLQDAYFIYLGANLENCKQRIRHRIANPEFEDDYPVSNYIFETYYSSDDGQLLSQILAQEFGIARRQVLLLENNGSLEEAKEKIAPFVDSIIDPETTEDETEDTPADNSLATPESSPGRPKVPSENKDYQLAGYLTR